MKTEAQVADHCSSIIALPKGDPRRSEIAAQIRAIFQIDDSATTYNPATFSKMIATAEADLTDLIPPKNLHILPWDINSITDEDFIELVQKGLHTHDAHSMNEATNVGFMIERYEDNESPRLRDSIKTYISSGRVSVLPELLEQSTGYSTDLSVDLVKDLVGDLVSQCNHEEDSLPRWFWNRMAMQPKAFAILMIGGMQVPQTLHQRVLSSLNRSEAICAILSSSHARMGFSVEFPDLDSVLTTSGSLALSRHLERLAHASA